MTTETIITAGYYRPDVAVKLDMLRDRFGYSESQFAGLYGKSLTLAVVRGGELTVLEGRLEVILGGYAHFLPKGCRTPETTLRASDVIGHVGGYGYASQVALNTQGEFNRITTEDVRGFLAKREMVEQEDAARKTAEAIARICRDVQIAQEERREADAKILSLLESPADPVQLAA
ncbi:hypothetical protein [Pseudarthrobacter phenanthrenivorans]|uniref:Uncharacterized protein n=1 Tax=Pseudarthrobacter phenanthrenivorans TaxID=361575 RepID=A0A0B4DQ00_PSEPS|nr:hypothetical protein [Pseudarthrobacter phenanthrenivorans]KIC68741.1 hypothetical protein RM50_04630 [Pseudarthrobacter phenanthrenivorans]